MQIVTGLCCLLTAPATAIAAHRAILSHGLQALQAKASDARHGHFACSGQKWRVGSPVAGGGSSLDQLPSLKFMRKPREPSALDVKRFPNRRLETAWITFNNEQHRILRRAQINWCKSANKIKQRAFSPSNNLEAGA